MSDVSEDDFEKILGLPSDICKAENASLDLLRVKSRGLYKKCYKAYTDWKRSSETTSSSERVLLAYFHSLANKYKPSSLWSYYSMLKSTIKINEKIDISKYHKLSAFIKKQSRDVQTKQSKVFSSEEVKQFLTEAPDDKYLLTKVALVFGIAGACRKNELTNIELQDLENHGDILLVKIPENKTSKPRSFTISDQFYKIVKKYRDLRPPKAVTERFFLNFRNGKCTVQVVGKNRFGTMPKEVATYLNLPNIDEYTGHCFRRIPATVFADSGANVTTLERHGGWKSSTVAEGYNKESIQNTSRRGTAINLRASTPNDSNNNSQEPPLKTPKIEYDVDDDATTSRQIKNRLPYTYRGYVVPVLTPFLNDSKRTLNLAIIPQYAKYLADRGITGVIVNGTSGEGPALPIEERKAIAEAWADAVKSTKQHLMIQVGGAQLPYVLELAKHAESLGADALLCLPELYFRPKTPEQLVEYLEVVGQAAPKTPLLYYHIPVMSNVNINMPKFLKAIGDRIPSFVGIKFTSTDLEEGMQAVHVNNKEFAVFLGNDQIMAGAFALGMDSAIPTTVNLVPELAVDLLKAGISGDAVKARKAQEKFSELVIAVSKYGEWVEVMKVAMRLLTPFDVGPSRFPLTPLSAESVASMKKDLKALGYQVSK